MNYFIILQVVLRLEKVKLTYKIIKVNDPYILLGDLSNLSFNFGVDTNVNLNIGIIFLLSSILFCLLNLIFSTIIFCYCIFKKNYEYYFDYYNFRYQLFKQ
jgi:hypothetical protein